jgi:hypothetical protein
MAEIPEDYRRINPLVCAFLPGLKTLGFQHYRLFLVKTLSAGSIVYVNLDHPRHSWKRAIVLQDGIQIGENLRPYSKCEDLPVITLKKHFL